MLIAVRPVAVVIVAVLAGPHGVGWPQGFIVLAHLLRKTAQLTLARDVQDRDDAGAILIAASLAGRRRRDQSESVAAGDEDHPQRTIVDLDVSARRRQRPSIRDENAAVGLDTDRPPASEREPCGDERCSEQRAPQQQSNVLPSHASDLRYGENRRDGYLESWSWVCPLAASPA
jgi:hypothetical protein